MTIDARKIAEEASYEPFVFVGLDGVEYELPNINSVGNRDGEAIAMGDPDALKRTIPSDAYEALMDMSRGVAIQVLAAWTEHGDATGKEDLLSAPTRRRGARSKATSGRAASTRKTSRSAN